MSALITICARAGSKGLPGKHMRLFNGKPLIQWTIEQAMECGLGEVVISTDDKGILDIAGKLEATALYRGASLSQDDTPKLEVLRDAVSFYNATFCDLSGKEKCEILIDLDSTNPCRRIEDILHAKWSFDITKPKVLFSVTKAKKNPFFNQVETICGFPRVVKWGDYVPVTRQELPEIWDMNSSIYVYNTDWLADPKNLSPVCSESMIFEMPEWSFCDIDTPADFVAAEALHRRYCLENVGAPVS